MRTVPAALAAVLLAGRPDLRAVLTPYGRQVGERVEVDLDALEPRHQQLREALSAYQHQTEAVWSRLGAGAPAGAWVVTRRQLVCHAQVTGKVGRCDLGDVYTQLSLLPATADILETATATTVDESALAAAVRLVGGDLTRNGDDLIVSVPLEGQVAWPVELGGPAGVFEVGRTVEFSVRHAAWRDRRVRRLTKVAVTVEELWADPRQARMLLPG